MHEVTFPCSPGFLSSSRTTKKRSMNINDGELQLGDVEHGAGCSWNIHVGIALEFMLAGVIWPLLWSPFNLSLTKKNPKTYKEDLSSEGAHFRNWVRFCNCCQSWGRWGFEGEVEGWIMQKLVPLLLILMDFINKLVCERGLLFITTYQLLAFTLLLILFVTAS